MATTGFWPVKSRHKEVIDYAENPDKTIDKKYVDSDLYAALQYAADDNKTDERMYVSGINCNTKRAYERMMATKKRFGKVGGNVAYHGYQSFQSGEVTPEEAHKIGMETARRMWGNEYEIVVTTHLNTDNVHNHFVVNSVSFKTGRKFENHISDHYKLREISDTVCLEHGKSVLKDATFYCGEKKDYWLKKKGNMTHRELLKSDIDSAIAQSTNFQAFEYRLKDMGYTIQRDMNYAHYSVKAPSWQRAISDTRCNLYIHSRKYQHLYGRRYGNAAVLQYIQRKELTPTLVNSLIERIEVHNNDKSSGHCYVKVDIYFTAVGMIDIPTEQEILAMMEEIRANPQEFRFVA